MTSDGATAEGSSARLGVSHRTKPPGMQGTLRMKATKATLTTIAADPRHLGAKLGMTMVLHTWG